MYYRSEIALEHVNSRREGYRRMSGGVKTSLCLRDFSVLKRSLLLLRKWINSIHLLIPYGNDIFNRCGKMDYVFTATFG